MTTHRATLPLHQRYALRPDEAAAYIGISETLFRKQVLPKLEVRYMGGRRLIRRVDVERAVDELPHLTGDDL